MENFDYRSARTYAGQYGAIIGLIWICSFACFIGGLHYPVLSHFSLLIGLASLFITIKLLNRFGRTVFPLKFSQATWMAILVYMYASLLFAAAQYIYFRFIDNGFLVSTYETLFQNPEYQKLLQQLMPGMEQQETAIHEAINMLYTITPIQLTFNFLIYNVFLGFILSLPTGFFVSRKNKTTRNN